MEIKKTSDIVKDCTILANGIIMIPPEHRKKWVALEDLLKFKEDAGRDPEGTLILIFKELQSAEEN